MRLRLGFCTVRRRMGKRSHLRNSVMGVRLRDRGKEGRRALSSPANNLFRPLIPVNDRLTLVKCVPIQGRKGV